jgi:hypothetical protein
MPSAEMQVASAALNRGFDDSFDESEEYGMLKPC